MNIALDAMGGDHAPEAIVAGAIEAARIYGVTVSLVGKPDVLAAESRLSDTGLDTTGVDDTTCCYATKTETWVTDPDGAKWEWYVKTGDAAQMANQVMGDDEGVACCAPSAAEPVTVGQASASASDGGCC